MLTENRDIKIEGGGLTLEEFYLRITQPTLARLSRQILHDAAGFQVTTLIWFGGRYRAVPKWLEESLC